MAVIRLRNARSPRGKLVLVTIYLTQMTTPVLDGEEKWFVILTTDELDSSGNRISDIIIDVAVAGDSIDSLVSDGLKTISSQVVWTELESDSEGPIITYQTHIDGEVNVSVAKDVMFTIEDPLPSYGINLSSISLVVNGVDVSNDLIIKGDPIKYDISWRPLRLL